MSSDGLPATPSPQAESISPIRHRRRRTNRASSGSSQERSSSSSASSSDSDSSNSEALDSPRPLRRLTRLHPSRHSDGSGPADETNHSSTSNTTNPNPIVPAVQSHHHVPKPKRHGAAHKQWARFRSQSVNLAETQQGKNWDLLPRFDGRRDRFRPSDVQKYSRAVVASREKERNLSPTRVEDWDNSNRVAGYCVYEQLALFSLIKWLNKCASQFSSITQLAEEKNFAFANQSRWTHEMYTGVIHSSCRIPLGDEKTHVKDAFYFATGACVFWGLSRQEERRHLEVVRQFSTSDTVAETEAENLAFGYGERSRVVHDAITLTSYKAEEKLAVSFALAQSAKLDVFEDRVESRIQHTQQLPARLSTTGSLQYSRKSLSKLIGQLFIELADVNLHSDVLDEPAFFWEDDSFQPLYRRMLKYLEVSKRVEVLNKRLEILRDLVEVLNQELGHYNFSQLEWIIIWLLAGQLFLDVVWDMLIKDTLGFFDH